MKPRIKFIRHLPGVCRALWNCSLPDTYNGWGSTPKIAYGHWVSNNKKLRIAEESSKEIRGASR